MSICPRVGGMAEYLDRLRTQPDLQKRQTRSRNILKHVPVVGEPAEQMLWQLKESLKQGLHSGMLFEEMGFRYIGPIDGHDIPQLLQDT